MESIDGDYAHLTGDGEVESHVAMFLLPEGTANSRSCFGGICNDNSFHL